MKILTDNFFDDAFSGYACCICNIGVFMFTNLIFSSDFHVPKTNSQFRLLFVIIELSSLRVEVMQIWISQRDHGSIYLIWSLFYERMKRVL